MKKHIWIYISYCLLIVFIFSSCRKNNNYIAYYKKVNEIDSIYRFQKDYRIVITKYKELFDEYYPKNNDRIEEFETYIRLADQYKEDFGGKRSLRELIPLIAPYWKYKKKDTSFIQLYKKYGIDSLEMEEEIAQWNKNLNKKLVDSFTIAFKRDQSSRKDRDTIAMVKDDKKNFELLKWMLDTEEYPGLQQIGLWNGDFFMSSGPLLLHLATYDEYLPYLKTKVLEYVQSGDCPPRDYAEMIDRNDLLHHRPYTYGVYQGYQNIIDTAQTDRNRKSIGLPSIKHSMAITRDFFKKTNVKK